MLRVASLSFVLVGSLALFAAQPHPSLPSDIVPDGLGVNIHFTDAQPGELDMLAQGGFRWIRMDFGWAAPLAMLHERLGIENGSQIAYGMCPAAIRGQRTSSGEKVLRRGRRTTLTASFGASTVAYVPS